MKALGLQPLAFREGRVPTVGVAVVEEARTPGCHGEGMELPTSLPASEAVKELKLLGNFYSNLLCYNDLKSSKTFSSYHARNMWK